MKYYIKNLNEFSEEKQKEYLLFLDKEKKEQYNIIKNLNRKKALLLSQGFLKEKVSDEYNIRREELIFSVSKSGKPFCLSHENIHFSVSHSGEYLAIAIGENEIGIDIEIYKKPPDKLIERICSANEKNLVDSSENKAEAFTEIWTKKEAYLKALGSGIDRELKSIDTTDEKFKFFTEFYDDFVLSVFSL